MRIAVARDRTELGTSAAREIAAALRDTIERNGRASVAFAAAPSQNETLAALVEEPGIGWSQVSAWHLDEYAGATAESSYSFRRFLREHIFRYVKPAVFHEIRGEALDTAAECARYASLLPVGGFDVALLGIGENGHLAFNDPPCDFDDHAAVRLVELDDVCRRQQVHDGAFGALSEVPTHAFTLTVPTLMAACRLFVMVPAPTKAAAVAAAIEGPLTNQCPASILRAHSNATLFLDRDSARLLQLP